MFANSSTQGRVFYATRRRIREQRRCDVRMRSFQEDLEIAVCEAFTQACMACDRTTMAAIWQRAQEHIHAISEQYAHQPALDLLRRRAIEIVQCFDRATAEFLSVLRSGAYVCHDRPIVLMEVAPLQQLFGALSADPLVQRSEFQTDGGDHPPLYLQAPKESLTTITALLVQLQARLHNLGASQNLIMDVEARITSTKENYQHLDWLLSLPDADLQSIVSMLFIPDIRCSIQKLRQLCLKYGGVQRFCQEGMMEARSLDHQPQEALVYGFDALVALEMHIVNSIDTVCDAIGKGDNPLQNRSTIARCREEVEKTMAHFLERLPQALRRYCETDIVEMRAWALQMLTFYQTILDIFPEFSAQGETLPLSNEKRQEIADVRRFLFAKGAIEKLQLTPLIGKSGGIEILSSLGQCLAELPRLCPSDFSKIFRHVCYAIRALHVCLPISCITAQHLLNINMENIKDSFGAIAEDVGTYEDSWAALQAYTVLQSRVQIEYERLSARIMRLGQSCQAIPELALRRRYFEEFSIAELEKMLQGVDVIIETAQRGVISYDLAVDVIRRIGSTDGLKTVLESLERTLVVLYNHGVQGNALSTVVNVLLMVIESDVAHVDWFCSLPVSELVTYSKMLQVAPHNFSVNRFRYFLEQGGSPLLFFSLSKKTKIGRSQVPPQFLTNEWFSFFTDLPPHVLQALFSSKGLVKILNLGLDLQSVQQICHGLDQKVLFAQLCSTPLEGIAFWRVFSVLTRKKTSIVEPLSTAEFEQAVNSGILETRQQLLLIEAMEPPLLPPQAYYILEREGRLPSFLDSLVSLEKVATEPLLRVLGAMPQHDARRWLEERVAGRQRYETLSQAQKEAIVSYFRTHDGLYPQPIWLKMFALSEEDGVRLCSRQPLASSMEELHNRLQQVIDPRDPRSLLLALGSWHDVFNSLTLHTGYVHLVMMLLISAQEVSLCGNRVVLTWGHADPSESLCCAQDGQPLVVREGDTSHALSQRGMLGHLSAPFSALSIRRRFFDLLPEGDLSIFSSVAIVKQRSPELFYELDRLASTLCERYGELFFHGSRTSTGPSDGEWQGVRMAAMDDDIMHVEEGEEPRLPQSICHSFLRFRQTAEWRTASTLMELVSSLFRHLTKDERISKGFVFQERSHTAAYALVSLLCLCRTSEISGNASNMCFALSPRTQYRISSFDLLRYEERAADNPWIPTERFHEYSSEYAPFTLSPLTPNKNLPPMCFVSLVRGIQRLSDSEFFELCARAVLYVQGMEPSPAPAYIDACLERWTGDQQLPEEARRSLTCLLEHYLSLIWKISRPLEPDATYYFSPREIGRFAPSDRVPVFLRSEGNFASAVCALYTPIEPRSHDGNCAIEAILLALQGKDAYSMADPESGGRLAEDIRAFRSQVVEYAAQHCQELAALFGQKDVEALIRTFASPKHQEWVSDIVHYCVARLYQRPIFILSRSGDRFTLDSQGQLVPSGRFYPEGEAQGPAIVLLFWGNAHYALLERRDLSPSIPQRE